jgi:hypothetical protein
VIVIGVQTLVSGFLVTVAVLELRRGIPPMVIGTVNHSWTTR